MLELAAELLPILDAGGRVAAISVTRVARSAPRGLGATMAVTADGAVIGSISGGCIEGDALMLGLSTLRDGIGRTASFGFDDESALAAGLACGGAIDVIAYPVTAAHRGPLERAARGEAVSVGVVASGARCGAVLIDPERFARSAVERRESALISSTGDGTASERVLVVTRAPRPRLIILGAGEHAAALCRVASAVGYAVTICDAWAMLVTEARFPDADQLVTAIPHEYLASVNPGDIDLRTAICVLTHDERLDVPALRVALGMPVGFVGAMGARSTAARRTELLHQAGIGDEALRRLHAPLGLDLGGATPTETALSILAEITAARHSASGLPLRDLAGPLHPRADAVQEAAVVATGCSISLAGINTVTSPQTAVQR